MNILIFAIALSVCVVVGIATLTSIEVAIVSTITTMAIIAIVHTAIDMVNDKNSPYKFTIAGTILVLIGLSILGDLYSLPGFIVAIILFGVSIADFRHNNRDEIGETHIEELKKITSELMRLKTLPELNEQQQQRIAEIYKRVREIESATK